MIRSLVTAMAMYLGTNNTVSTKEVSGNMIQMHRTSFTTRTTRLFAQQLREDGLHQGIAHQKLVTMLNTKHDGDGDGDGDDGGEQLTHTDMR